MTTEYSTPCRNRSKQLEATADITDADVLFGRGKSTQLHAGNSRFRELVVERAAEYYQNANDKGLRRSIALEIIRIIESEGGRFLKLVNANANTTSVTTKGGGAAVRVGDWAKADLATSIVKVKQALRDTGANATNSDEKRSTSTKRYGSCTKPPPEETTDSLMAAPASGVGLGIVSPEQDDNESKHLRLLNRQSASSILERIRRISSELTEEQQLGSKSQDLPALSLGHFPPIPDQSNAGREQMLQQAAMASIINALPPRGESSIAPIVSQQRPSRIGDLGAAAQVVTASSSYGALAGQELNRLLAAPSPLQLDSNQGAAGVYSALVPSILRQQIARMRLLTAAEQEYVSRQGTGLAEAALVGQESNLDQLERVVRTRNEQQALDRVARIAAYGVNQREQEMQLALYHTDGLPFIPALPQNELTASLVLQDMLRGSRSQQMSPTLPALQRSLQQRSFLQPSIGDNIAASIEEAHMGAAPQTGAVRRLW